MSTKCPRSGAQAKGKRASSCEANPLTLLLFLLVRPAGIEPTTPWFVGVEPKAKPLF